MFILTDFPRFPARWKTSTIEGEARTSLAGASFTDLFRLIPDIRRADLIILHEGASKLFSVLLFFCLLPFLRTPIISVDLILRKPHSAKQKLAARFKRILLGRVSLFINYFQALDAYEKYFGISSARSSYVPFKANIIGTPGLAEIAAEEKEEYILAVGQSLRDFDTFFEAVSKLSYPAAILQPNFERLRHHGSRFTWDMQQLPKNMTLLEDDGSKKGWIRNLCKARVIVIPILGDTLCPAGISVYLDAMLLNKCVVISSGPGVSDVLSDQVVIVPPENPEALAQAIQKVLENPTLRTEVAARGQRYASALGGEPELMNRILESAVSWYLKSSKGMARAIP